jgi:nucleoside-diphosphate-sugar epimerase
MLVEKKLKVGVVGGSGTLGSALIKTIPEAVKINRNENSSWVRDSFDVTFVCAPSGLKWFANQNPNQDLLDVENLILLLEKMKSGRFILFSTIDAIDAEVNPTNYYGAHRRKLEEYILKNNRGSIIRLGALVAPFVKKNFLFDIKERNIQYYPNLRSRFQFSNLYVWNDLVRLVLNQDFLVFNYFSKSLTMEFLLGDLCNDIFLTSKREIVNYAYDNNNDNSYLASFNLKFNSDEKCHEIINKYMRI